MNKNILPDESCDFDSDFATHGVQTICDWMVISMQNLEFWIALDKLIEESSIIIDRPKGSRHPRYPDALYHLDYGYLRNTSSMDGDGFDVWVGTRGDKICDAIICTVDLIKKDSEMKLVIGCCEEEKDIIMESTSENMKKIMIQRW